MVEVLAVAVEVEEMVEVLVAATAAAVVVVILHVVCNSNHARGRKSLSPSFFTRRATKSGHSLDYQTRQIALRHTSPIRRRSGQSQTMPSQRSRPAKHRPCADRNV
jgi:hypothetical protein